jgi:hypothetical protein
MSEDIVSDILQRVVATVPPRIAQQLGLQLVEIEVQVRRDWGGERHYIARRADDPASRAYMARRDATIRREHRAGATAKLLSRRHGLSMRRIQQILADGQEA